MTGLFFALSTGQMGLAKAGLIEIPAWVVGLYLFSWAALALCTTYLLYLVFRSSTDRHRRPRARDRS